MLYDYQGKGAYVVNMVGEKIFDYRKLKGRIVEKYNTMTAFAEAIGKPTQQITNKINDGSAFNSNTVIEWADALDIELSDYGIYFFTLKV